MSLDRYSKRFTKIRQRELRNIQDFFDVYFKKTPDIWLNCNEFYTDLNSTLKTKLIISTLNPLRKKFNFFFKDKDHDFKANKVFTRDILSSLYIQTYLPNNTVISFKENVEDLSFINKGEVIIYDKNTTLSIIMLQSGSYFGDF